MPTPKKPKPTPAWTDAARDSRRYNRLPPEERDKIANQWAESAIYFCPECDEEHPDDYTECPRYPREHDETGYMGTGTKSDPNIRRLAKKISQDE